MSTPASPKETTVARGSRRARRTLAIDGGTPIRATPFPPRAAVTVAEKEAVNRLLDHLIASGEPIGYSGPEEDAYCAEFARTLGGGYADCVNSGTAAVYVALRALELEPFTEVVVGPLGDPGGVMPIALLNCVPVVADAAPGSYNTGPEQVEACLSDRTAAIVVPHIGGEPAAAAALASLAARHGVPLVEDCAQAHGARLDGRALGSFGRVAAFSTMHGKHLHTGGQGGMVFTREAGLLGMARSYADRGKVAGDGNRAASLNLNLDELGAAIGRVQLARLAGNVAARRRVAATLGAGLDAATGGAITLPPQPPGAEPSFWFLRLRYHGELLACTREAFCAALAAEGIPLRESPPMPHTFAWFRERRVFGSSGYPWMAPAYGGDRNRTFPCPNAHAAVADHFAVSISEQWGQPEVDDTLAALEKVVAVHAL